MSSTARLRLVEADGELLTAAVLDLWVLIMLFAFSPVLLRSVDAARPAFACPSLRRLP